MYTILNYIDSQNRRHQANFSVGWLTHWNPLQHTATHCNTMQHTATHGNNCNTLQQAPRSKLFCGVALRTCRCVSCVIHMRAMTCSCVWQTHFYVWHVMVICIKWLIDTVTSFDEHAGFALSLCLCLALFPCLSICLSLSVYLSLSVSLPLLYVCLSVCLCIGLSVCLPGYLSVCQSVCMSVGLSISQNHTCSHKYINTHTCTQVSSDFKICGGSEFAPMSTTTDPKSMFNFFTNYTNSPLNVRAHSLSHPHALVVLRCDVCIQIHPHTHSCRWVRSAKGGDRWINADAYSNL